MMHEFILFGLIPDDSKKSAVVSPVLQIKLD